VPRSLPFLAYYFAQLANIEIETSNHLRSTRPHFPHLRVHKPILGGQTDVGSTSRAWTSTERIPPGRSSGNAGNIDQQFVLLQSRVAVSAYEAPQAFQAGKKS
jgi:hypothetical protein